QRSAHCWKMGNPGLMNCGGEVGTMRTASKRVCPTNGSVLQHIRSTAFAKRIICSLSAEGERRVHFRGRSRRHVRSHESHYDKHRRNSAERQIVSRGHA